MATGPGLLLLLLPVGAIAEPAPRVVEVIGATADVHDLAELDGATLVATGGGLVVRSTEGERVIGPGDGLPGTRVRSVSVVGRRVWVGAVEAAALLALGPDGAPTVLRTVALPRIVRVVERDGAVWMASHGAGLHRLEPGPAGALRRMPLGRDPALDRQTDLLVVGEELWVATAGAGILRVDRDGRLLGRVRGASDLVWDLERDGTRVLAATSAGLTVLDPLTRAPVADERLAALVRRLPVRDIRAVRRAGAALVVATWGAGAYRLPDDAARPIRISPAGALHARAVLTERDGGVVIGHDAGLLRAAGDGPARAVGQGGLPSADVSALAAAFGHVWVGTFDRGLARISAGRVEPATRATERWALDRRINDLAVTGAATASETLWIATDRGLWAHDGRRFWPIETPLGRDHANDLWVDPGGRLWVATTRQLARRDPHGRWTTWTGTEQHPFAQLQAVTTDAAGLVWIGSLHGLYRLDPRDGSVQRHTVSSGALPVDWVTALAPWGDGIVAGTYNGGLVRFDGRSFTRETAPSQRWVNPRAVGGLAGELWVGTLQSGLALGRPGRWISVPALPSADVTAVLRIDPRSAWVATRGGLARIEWGHAPDPQPREITPAPGATAHILTRPEAAHAPRAPATRSPSPRAANPARSGSTARP